MHCGTSPISERRPPLRCAASLVLLLLLAASITLHAGETLGFEQLEHYTTRDGLSQNWVTKMSQDQQGFLWIGTSDGLNRYDGYSFKTYRHDSDDPRSISNGFVIRVFEDRSGDLWIGTKRGLNRLDRLTDQFERFVPDPDRPDSLSHDFVTDVNEDRDGRLWVATTGGLNRLERETGGFTRYLHDPEDPGSLGARGVLRIRKTRDGDLWFGVGRWLHRLEGDGGRFVRFPLIEESDTAENIHILTEDAEGRLWAGTQEGNLIAFDPQTGELTRHLLSASGIRFINYVLPRSDGSLWVGTDENGLLVFAPETGTWSGHRNDPDNPGSLTHNRVMSLYEDRTGVVWIATSQGLDKLEPSRTRFSHDRYRPEDPDSLSADSVTLVAEDSRGNLWIGAEDGGLNRLDRTGRNTRYRHAPEKAGRLRSDTVFALLEDSEGIYWFGTDSGVERFDPDRGRFSRPGTDFEVTGGLQEDRIYQIVESEPGVLWIGGVRGLYRLDVRSMEARFHRLQESESFGPQTNTIYDLEIDQRGDLWIVTGGSGLYRLRQTGNGRLPAGPGPLDFDSFRHDVNDPTSLSSNIIATIFEDRAGTLWIGTLGGGLNRIHQEESEVTFTRYREVDALANDNVEAILEDDRGNLWLGCYGALTRLDPRTGESRSFTEEDGLPGTDFSFSATRKSSGELVFGSTEGLIGFFPERLKDDPHAPQVAITDFRLFNRSLPLSARGLSRSDDAARLTLSYRDAIFGFELAALHFAKPGLNRYAYRMEGFNNDWIETDARNRFVQYTNLDPGDYVFRAKAANADGVWNEDGVAIRIVVEPPPWKTWWAYSLYILALVSMVFAYVLWHRSQLRRERQAAQRERAVNRRLREVDKLKDEFLAKTSHELRTPLYGITGLAESLVGGARGQLPEAARADLTMVVASGRRLSHLVSDILDFSKLRHKSLELDRRPVDLKPLANVVLTLSRPLVGAKALELVNAVPAGLPAADADENRLQQILYNLVGNAVKFTESGQVEVSASVTEGKLRVRVADTGIGIPEADRERIFEAFEQAEASLHREHGGTGLGLAVTRQLVELHGGAIHLESTPGEGSVFSFTLPIAAEMAPSRPSVVLNPIFEEGDPPVPAGADVDGMSAEGPRVLVVDDEPVNLQVVRNYLAVEKFRLTLASSGEEALRRLGEESFDLVLLDVMMPRISGYDVCRKLRESHPMSDLPVIFLTARTQDSDVVAGMALGANDYLAKPISKDRLLARIRPHLDLLQVHRGLEDLVEQKVSEIKVLEGILPICAGCKKIRDEDGLWNELEAFIDERSEAEFSHGICPDCVGRFYSSYPELRD